MNKASTARKLSAIPRQPPARLRKMMAKQRARGRRSYIALRNSTPTWDYSNEDGSSAARLRHQLRWLVAQELDYFFDAPDSLVSGGYTSSPTTVEVLNGPKIIDFVAYKEEGVIRDAS